MQERIDYYLVKGIDAYIVEDAELARKIIAYPSEEGGYNRHVQAKRFQGI